MPPKSSMPSCGFQVFASKKGELPVRVEKRPKGKRATVIPNVTGDASKLVRALQTMFGVGGTVRHAGEGSWNVEIQGDQTARVIQALQDFQCLKGLNQEALESLRKAKNDSASASVVVRNDASKFLAQTQAGGKLSIEEERRKMLDQEAEFYGNFWHLSASAVDDFSDIWEETLLDIPRGEREQPLPEQELGELNVALQGLGLLACCGQAVREFWQLSGMTVTQFRKMALNPGARLIDEGPGKKVKPTNLKSRQKHSDRASGGRGGCFFTPTVSAIDAYERGISRDAVEEALVTPEVPKMVVETDAEGWCTAALSYVAPLLVPATRLDEDEKSRIAKDALRAIEARLEEDLGAVQKSVPGVECRLDCSTFGMDLHIFEGNFLQGARKDTGKAPNSQEKEELKLEKKLRDILSLKRRQLQGEKLEKLQADKVARREELFSEVAELKLRRADRDILRVFKRHGQRFKDAFWELEWKALYGDEPAGQGAAGQAASGPAFGTFNEDAADAAVKINARGDQAESKANQWVGAELRLSVNDGEVGAFAVEILEGLVRLGWVVPGGSAGELGSDALSFGFGGTGKKVSGGAFEAYGQPFKVGDVVHCEAEREEGQLRIGFAKNDVPLGVAFEVSDSICRGSGVTAAVCGKGFKVRIVSAESVPLDEAPGLAGYVEYDPPRPAVATRNFSDDSELAESFLEVWAGELLQISADDGEGSVFGFFLDQDDGGWLPASCVQLLDVEEAEEEAGQAWGPPPAKVDAGWGPPSVKVDAGWGPPAVQAEDDWASPPASGQDDGWGAAPLAPPPPAGAPAAAAGGVEGLEEWLRGLSLQKYEQQAIEWCQEMGAVAVEEVEECWEEFADAMALKNLERKRLAKAMAAK